jgi:hypothetical protein
MSDTENPQYIYARYLLDDAATRPRYQHEFSLAGFRTLILINGGAIIGLLTYAGNVLVRLEHAILARLSSGTWLDSQRRRLPTYLLIFHRVHF